jgi:hypothetical protein
MEKQRMGVFKFDILHSLCNEVAANRVYRRISGM